ncbi:MAG TPA: S8 family serine peptidase [Ohtaekwangia sp.]
MKPSLPLVCVRHASLPYVILLMLLSSVLISVHAQEKTAIEPGVIRIKVKEELAAQLEQSKMMRSSGNHVLTGIQSLDRLSERFTVSNMKRVFRPSGKFEAKHRKYGLHLWYEIQLDPGMSIQAAREAFSSLAMVEESAPVYKKEIIEPGSTSYLKDSERNKPSTQSLTGPPNDFFVNYHWSYNNTGQFGGTLGADIDLYKAWAIETGKSDVIVAIIDGGVDTTHPDLVPNLWTNAGEIPGNGIDDDDNGYTDDIHGYGFGDNSNVITPHYHGTHVAGTVAAATNNGIGVAGIAGGSGTGDGVRLMSCASFGAVSTGNFDDALVYAADNGAVVAQNSWIYTVPNAYNSSELVAIDYFIAEAGKDEAGNQVGPMNGGIVIFAAGNNNSNAAYFPAYYSHVVAVSSVNDLDKKAGYSNYGNWIDISAPGGEAINSFNRMILSTGVGGVYTLLQGTSMACPHVSGVAALMVSKFKGPGLTPAFIRGRLIESADRIEDLNPLYLKQMGSGRLNAFKALQETETTPPDAIINLAATDATITSILLTWTAPGENGIGQTAQYDFRYSTSPITVQNFNLATQVLDELPPRSAGDSETLWVKGLLPDTRYYFAAKSTDFYGNISDISNVAQYRTDVAPVISINPTSLQADLITRESENQTVTIHNTGGGVLEFYWQSINYNINVYPTVWSGTIPPYESREIEFVLSAEGLATGVYNADFKIISNDPLNSTLVMPITLNVTSNGFPIAVIQHDDSVNFYGDRYIGGLYYWDWKYIYNEGSEPLVIYDVTCTNPFFRMTFGSGNSIEDTLTIAPFGDDALFTYFEPIEPGLHTGEIYIHTNDPNRPLITLYAKGNALKSPKDLQFPRQLPTDTAYVNSRYRTSFWMWNDGVEDVNVQFDDYEWDMVTYSLSSATLHPGDSVEVTVEFELLWPGYSDFYVTFQTDDPKFQENGGYAYTTIFLDVIEPEFVLSEDTIHYKVEKDKQQQGVIPMFNLSGIHRSFQAQLDNSSAFPSSLLSVTPLSGSISANDTTDFTFTVDTHGIDYGTYTTTLIIDVGHSPLFVPVVVEVFAPPVIDLSLDSIQQVLPINAVQTVPLQIMNIGGADLNYSIHTNSVPVHPGGIRKFQTGFEYDDIADSVYATGGWHVNLYPDEYQWSISSENPFSGSRHLRCQSGDNLGYGTSIYSPDLTSGTAEVSIAEMMIDVDRGVSWEIGVWSDGLSGYIFGNFLLIAPDGSLQTLVKISSELSELKSIPGTLPDGYFKLRFTTKASTGEFTISVNDTVIASDIGVGKHYSEVYFACGTESTGPILDIDDIRIYDGDQPVPWLQVDPASGTIPMTDSQPVNVVLDSRGIDPGVYADTLKIISNDLVRPVVSVPVRVIAEENIPPTIEGALVVNAIANETLTVRYSGSDPDDTNVTLTDYRSHPFPGSVVYGNGHITYTFKPTVSDIGRSRMNSIIYASDGRGGFDSKYVEINVLPFQVKDFSLVWYSDYSMVKTFTDTVDLDIADPVVSMYTIRANTSPNKVGSIRFTLDGAEINIDNTAPYSINHWVLPVLSEGYHVLTAQAFTNSNAQGVGGQVRKTIIRVFNSAAITDFDLVNGSGVKLMDLEEGSVIDISQPGFSSINIVANTSINTVRSVRFVTGTVTIRIDNRAPYAMRGNSDGTDTFWPVKPGSYSIKAIPYMMYYGWGPRGIPLTVNFKIIQSATPAVARLSSDGPLEVEEFTTQEEVLQIYPVPVNDLLTIYVNEKIEGDIRLSITNAQGQVAHEKDGPANSLRTYTVSTSGLGLSQGVYFVILQQSNGRRTVKKIIKE